MGGQASKLKNQNQNQNQNQNKNQQSYESSSSSSSRGKEKKNKLRLRGSGYVTTAPDDNDDDDDEFYDGIPRYNNNNNTSRSRRVAKVSEVSSLIGRASSVGLERAFEVLDTLGSSMTNLNPKTGFAASTKAADQLSILAFEVANTIVKASTLMHSLSTTSITQLKQEILTSQGVQQLISTDMDQLLNIVATDKREELKLFSGEVVRFGNRCKDPQWHNLDRYFDKQRREHSPRKQSREEAESVMQHLMILVQHTAELYHELHVLDKFEQDYRLKQQEEGKSNTTRKGNNVTISVAELKSQRKLTRNLKKRSLWPRSLEEIIEKLVDVVLFLNQELSDAFGNTVADTPEKGFFSNRQRLGPAGLALHYANIILQIDSIVARSSVIPPNARDTLYQNLPPSIKSSLRSKLNSFHVKKELTIAEIKAEMEKTLEWLVPIATNTAKAHHGFGWVGEWANTGSELNRQSVAPTEVIQIETLHHADIQKTEVYILELVLWLNHLVSQSKVRVNCSNVRPTIKSQIGSSFQQTDEQPKAPTNALPTLSVEDQEMMQELNNKKQSRGISKSQDFDLAENRTNKLDKLNKSSSYSPTRGNNELKPSMLRCSTIPGFDFTLGKEKMLDVIDRVESPK